MDTELVSSSGYTDDDMINTIRILPGWWFCLTEHLVDPMGDTELSGLVTQQRSALHQLAIACDLPKELLNLPLDGEHELSLGAGLLRKRMDKSKYEAMELCLDQSIVLLHQAAHRVRQLRRPPVLTDGVVSGLFVSHGGVPKRPVESVQVEMQGITGDDQATRKHHGRPWQALCLWSAEVVDQLAEEGHPIQPGNAGENISIEGLNWSEVLPGAQICIGDMVCEISTYALPCSKNARWFSDRDYERMHHRRNTSSSSSVDADGARSSGLSRLYASVVETGTIKVGDTVTLF
jgi:MOSC domain-containing protein YiiM